VSEASPDEFDFALLDVCKPSQVVETMPTDWQGKQCVIDSQMFVEAVANRSLLDAVALSFLSIQ
jgi:hypothetical protein